MLHSISQMTLLLVPLSYHIPRIENIFSDLIKHLQDKIQTFPIFALIDVELISLMFKVYNLTSVFESTNFV